MSITVLAGKRIVLGVTGSIACYKSVDLASKLTQAGAKVDVVLTESAARFVSPLTFRSITGREVYSDMWDLEDHVRHVQLGESADLLIVAPATAHTLAKMAHGLADNLLSVVVLAARCPVLVAPAMDGGMYEHPATQANLRLLEDRGLAVAGPGLGRMASGLVGKGRMLEPAVLLGHIRLLLGSRGSFNGKRVVVTAGPTREPLDPVRFLSNYSSGKQGIALAQAALDVGATVTLITGPVQQNIPRGANHVAVKTALEMHDAVLAAVEEADVLLMAAAVADFRPADLANQKIKKTGNKTEVDGIRLVRNPDILIAVRNQKLDIGRPTITLGFAAETQNLINNGRDKLKRKGLDFIVVNNVGAVDAGFESENNRVVLLSAKGQEVEMPLQSKTIIAEQIIAIVARALEEIDG